MTEAKDKSTLPWTFCLVSVILFFFMGLVIVPYIGIQTDEAIFAGPLFPHGTSWFAVSVFQKKVPLMVMSYLGATKTWLYPAIFAVWEPSTYSLRIPALLIGAASVIAFFVLLRRTAGNRAACFGTALLACDSSYFLTTTMDWGPVAIQHLCFLSGLVFLVTAHQSGRLLPLGAGSFSLGLGCWDKALFVWMLSAAAIAGVLIFYKEIRRNLSIRRITVAGFFFILGAFPLILYNIRQPLQTFRGNAHFSGDDRMSKLYQMRGTLNGSALFGYLVDEDWHAKSRPLRPGFEQGVVAWTSKFGERRRHFYWYAFCVALLITPVVLFSRWRRYVLFCMVTLTIAWGEMFVTKGAGAATHHTILLWPLPTLIITIAAICMAEKFGRWGTAFLWVLGLLLCGSAMLVNQYYLSQAIKNGAPGSWTNAIFSLARRLPAYDADRIYVTDWGMLDNTRLLTRGELQLIPGSEPLMQAEPSGQDRKNAATMLADKRGLFVSNTDDRQTFPDVNPRLRRLAADLGYRRELLEVIYDYNGKPSFEIFRFVPVASTP